MKKYLLHPVITFAFNNDDFIAVVVVVVINIITTITTLYKFLHDHAHEQSACNFFTGLC